MFFTRSAPEVMPPILLYCPMTSEVDVSGMAVEFEPSCQYPITFCCVRQKAAKWQFDKMMSDMEVCLKQRCGVEFLHVEKMEPIDFHWHLLNVSGD